jgi:hypothetical protein
VLTRDFTPNTQDDEKVNYFSDKLDAAGVKIVKTANRYLEFDKLLCFQFSSNVISIYCYGCRLGWPHGRFFLSDAKKWNQGVSIVFVDTSASMIHPNKVDVSIS